MLKRITAVGSSPTRGEVAVGKAAAGLLVAVGNHPGVRILPSPPHFLDPWSMALGPENLLSPPVSSTFAAIRQSILLAMYSEVFG